MTTTTRNEAAERLIAAINGPEPDPDSIAQPRHVAAELIRRDMPGILAAERRATVERIRAALGNGEEFADALNTAGALRRRMSAILDAEAAR